MPEHETEADLHIAMNWSEQSAALVSKRAPGHKRYALANLFAAHQELSEAEGNLMSLAKRSCQAASFGGNSGVVGAVNACYERRVAHAAEGRA